MPSITLSCINGQPCCLNVNQIVQWDPRHFGSMVKTCNITGEFPSWRTRGNGHLPVEETPQEISAMCDAAEVAIAVAVEWAMRSGPPE